MARKSYKKYVLVFISLCIMCFGITLLLKSNLGVDPYSVFLDGMSKKTGLSFGGISILISLSVIVAAYIYSYITKKDLRLGDGTLLYLFGFGLILDFLIFITPTPLTLVLKMIYLIAGIICLGIGTGIFIKVDIGIGTLEIILFLVANGLGLSIKTSKILFDFLACLIGYLIGGVFGIGTILCIICIGPIIQKVVDH